MTALVRTRMITAIFDAIRLLEFRVLESANSAKALLSCQCNDFLGTRIRVQERPATARVPATGKY